MGLLRVRGTLDTTQLWPHGTSDADTAKLLVDVHAKSFAYQANPGGPFKTTKLFNTAKVKGKGAPKPVVDNKGRITVRLQAIDAPELHYMPTLPSKPKVAQALRDAFNAVSEEFRQRFGETSTFELAKKLGPGVLAAEAVSRIDLPNDAFDTYGRFVAEITVTKANGEKVNVNRWLARQGWALVTFYNSMTSEEITDYRGYTIAARKAKRGLYDQGYSAGPFGPIDFALRYRRPPVVGFASGSDAGPTVVPKIFRRQSPWSCETRAGISNGSFKGFLERKRDDCYETDDFLDQGHAAKTRHLDEFIDGKRRFTVRPEELVFRESPSTLLNAAGNKITGW